MVDERSETMPEDLRQALSDALRLYNHWRFEPLNLPAPTLAFRTPKISLNGIFDLVVAYKDEPLPLAIRDELWPLIEEMKLKAELAIDPQQAPACWMRSFKAAGRHLIPEPPTRDGRRLHLTTSTRLLSRGDRTAALPSALSKRR
jgi:hypothetical protein